MRKFLIQFGLFLLFALITYSVLLTIWGNALNGKYHKNLRYKQGLTGFMHSRLLEADTSTQVEVLFLGSSHTYRGFDTRIFAAAGMRSFNLGSSNQTPLQTTYLLQEYVDRFRPKLVIYEVFPENFEMDGVESAVDIISNTAHYGHVFWQALAVNHVVVYNAFLYGFMRKVFYGDLAFREAAKVGEDTYVLGAYVQKDFRAQPRYLMAETMPLDVESVKLGDKLWRLKGKQVAAFGESIELLKQKNIPVLLVQAPVSKGFFEAYKNYAYTDSLFASYGLYINFNYENLALNDSTDFYDAHHLAQSGVIKFNAALIEKIKPLGLFHFN
ncbi:MAG: hypothetical protein SGJ00_12765 [bacterium]|nr:hypothetical protein [bacterium]